jgi:UDP-GlcNAc:undecaprenyl-phosphate/decaprenyl-phosphate GlcNAc-1-phosphate transferase
MITITYFFFLFFSFAIIFYLIFKLDFWKIYSYPDSHSKIIKNNRIKTSTYVPVIFLIILFALLYNYTTKEIAIETLNANIYLISIILFISILGYVDDIFNIDVFAKLLLFFVVSLLLVAIKFPTLNIYYYIIIALFILCFINVVNLIDGLDGFLGQYAFFFCINFYIIFHLKGGISLTIFEENLFIIFAIANIAFLFFNVTGKILMGNAGSMFYAIITSYMLLVLVANHYFWEIIILVAYPMLDIFFTFFKKIYFRIDLMKRDFPFYFLNLVKEYKKKHTHVFLLFLLYNLINTSALTLSLTTNLFIGVFFSIFFSLALIVCFKRNVF